MGTEKIISNEDAQIKIADKFITWGWKDKKQKRKVVPFYSILISNLKKKYNYTKAKGIRFCQTSFPNYFAPIIGQITYTDKIYLTKKANEVFNNLNSSLKKEYVIRYLDSESEDNICHPALIKNKIRKDRGELK